MRTRFLLWLHPIRFILVYRGCLAPNRPFKSLGFTSICRYQDFQVAGLILYAERERFLFALQTYEFVLVLLGKEALSL